ncbi:MAG: substrate-binding domain-containing protein [Anaerolineales bacterium]
MPVLLLSVLVAGCNSPTEPQDTLRINISPAAHPASEAVLTCAPRDEGPFVSIDSFYPGTFLAEDYDIVIRLGEPQADGFAAQLAWERIVLIVNPAVGIVDLSRAQAADLFSGRAETWDGFGGTESPITIWVAPQSDEARQMFTEQVLLGVPIASHALLASQPSQLLIEVAADPNAAGLLPAAWVDGSVQQVELELRVPILALTTMELEGAARQLLACLQSEIGQAVLGEIYEPLAPGSQTEE